MDRILHILNTSTFSGAENVALTIIKNMDLNNYEVAYMALNGPIQKKVESNNIKFFGVNKLSISNIKNVIDEYQPTIIHAHDFRASCLASFFSKKCKIISHLHNNDPYMKKWTAKSLVYFLRLSKFNKVIGVSNSVLNECVYKKQLEKKFICFSNPIDIKSINKQVFDYDKKYDIVFVGRLVEQKDPIRFVNIIKKIRKIDSKINCVMVGAGDFFDKVKQNIIDCGLEQNIKMMGFVDDPYRIMAQSKMLYLTSKWEGFGLVIVEAMALGLPVAATNVGGVSQIIKGGIGKLCDTDEDFLDFYQLMQNNEVYRDFSVSARQAADKFDNIEKYIEGLINIYNN